ncbi:thioredoxin domain-containing protein-like [Pecten maximus]|uniref:thioredoxin domain-containing protein-like n=1 Tax=Pecten maximus TaxID=6579 RepID=UPI001458B90D|nr:thioredoxin domain-containing protein-like [Pecten maximus]
MLLVGVSTCRSQQLEVVSKDAVQEIIKDTKYVLVLFFYDMETCPWCVAAEKELLKVNTMPDLYDHAILIIKCEDPGTAVKYGVTTVPQVVYFRDGVPALFEVPQNAREIRTMDVEIFVEEAQQVAIKTLDDDSFEHLTQAATGATTGDWLIIFYRPSCDSHLSAVEGAGIKLRHKMNVAKINLDGSPRLEKRFKIKDCPTTYFFRLGRMYHYFSEDPDQYRVHQLISFVSTWYKNVKAESVPIEPTAFDALTEGIADYLKDLMHGPNRGKFLLGLGFILGIVSLVLAIVAATCPCRRKEVKLE